MKRLSLSRINPQKDNRDGFWFVWQGRSKVPTNKSWNYVVKYLKGMNQKDSVIDKFMNGSFGGEFARGILYTMNKKNLAFEGAVDEEWMTGDYFDNL